MDRGIGISRATSGGGLVVFEQPVGERAPEAADGIDRFLVTPSARHPSLSLASGPIALAGWRRIGGRPAFRFVR